MHSMKKIVHYHRGCCRNGSRVLWGLLWRKENSECILSIVYRLQVQIRVMENIRQKAKKKKKDQNGHEWGETAVKLASVA